MSVLIFKSFGISHKSIAKSVHGEARILQIGARPVSVYPVGVQLHLRKKFSMA